nr:MAG TPA: hypothetical protein [Caudoviricetes sp.]
MEKSKTTSIRRGAHLHLTSSSTGGQAGNLKGATNHEQDHQ